METNTLFWRSRRTLLNINIMQGMWAYFVWITLLKVYSTLLLKKNKIKIVCNALGTNYVEAVSKKDITSASCIQHSEWIAIHRYLHSRLVLSWCCQNEGFVSTVMQRRTLNDDIPEKDIANKLLIVCSVLPQSRQHDDRLHVPRRHGGLRAGLFSNDLTI